MKTNTTALMSVPSQNQDLPICPLLDKKNGFISQLLGCEVKNAQVLCIISISFLLVLSFIFATDGVALYGWSAFFALSAVCVAATGLRNLFATLAD